MRLVGWKKNVKKRKWYKGLWKFELLGGVSETGMLPPWIVLIGGSSTRTGRLSGRVKLNLSKRWPTAVIVAVFVAGKFERSNLNSCWDCHEIFEQLWFVWEVAAGVGLLLGTMAKPGIHFWLEKIELLNSIFKKCILNLHIFLRHALPVGTISAWNTWILLSHTNYARKHSFRDKTCVKNDNFYLRAQWEFFLQCAS